MGILRSRESLLSAGVRKRWLPGRIGAAVCIIICLLLPLAELLVMDYYNYDGDMDRYIEHFHLHPDTFCFEILVMYTLFFTLLFLLRRLYLTSFLMTALALICSFVHYMKVNLNGDPFMPNDLVMIGSTGQLMAFMEDAKMPPHFTQAVVAAVILMVIMFPFRKRMRIRSRKVMIIGLLLAALCLHLVFDSGSSRKLMGKFNLDPNNAAMQSSNYSANGFVGAFTLNVFSLYVEKPAGYSEAAVKALLEPYQQAPKTEAAKKQPDIILVLNESFTDIREVEQLKFSRNPLEQYDKIRKNKNCISGKLYVSAYEGGTVRPEFEILTGLTVDGLPGGILPYAHVRRPMETYVSYLKNAGYYTLAIHPYYMKFYDRYYAYESVGFQDFFGEGALTEQFSDIEYSPQNRITDTTMADMIGHYLDESEKPCFLFAITMENHQPYLKMEEKQLHVKVSCSDSRLDPGDLDMVNTYTSNLYDADRMLGDLCRFMDKRKEPTMLVFFGDHKPNLGNTYASLGTFDKDGVSLGDYQKQYATPFLIYTNFTPDRKNSLLHTGTDNQVSTYNLMNAALKAAGMEQTPYMRLLEDFYGTMPYYNVRLGLPLEEKADEYINAMRMITYDRIFGNNYSSVVK
ncbi:MAG: LTA synthase family protein [Firmicutes bacterium]|nr:LTA synthase family protein [Bacillota bacterium]